MLKYNSQCMFKGKHIHVVGGLGFYKHILQLFFVFVFFFVVFLPWLMETILSIFIVEKKIGKVGKY